ncbi:MAG: HAD family hydrolase, partial [Phycisphaeraceae bacterium]|nr:HAD family hydrolase [Phycisphaeraceae bacterium]
MDAAVFLDRDNTLIDNDGDLGDPAQVKLLRGAAPAIASLRGLGYKIVVVSNQGGVARGKYTEQDVQAVHRKISELVEATSSGKIDRYYFCPFHPEAKLPAYKKEHPWRKPQPGMLFEAARQMELDLSQSWTIGDQLRDIEAGAAAGTRTILLTDPKGDGASDAQRAGSSKVEPDFVCRSLTEAARIIAQQRRPEVHPDARNRDSVNRVKMAHERLEEQQARDAKIRQAVAQMQQASGAAVVEPAEPAPAPVAPTPPTASPPVVATPTPARSLPLGGPSQDTPEEPVPTPATGQVDVGTTLREILQELRHQRDRGDDFGPRHIVALALQVVAVICLIVGFSLSSGEPGTFLKALGAGLMVQ